MQGPCACRKLEQCWVAPVKCGVPAHRHLHLATVAGCRGEVDIHTHCLRRLPAPAGGIGLVPQQPPLHRATPVGHMVQLPRVLRMPLGCHGPYSSPYIRPDAGLPCNRTSHLTSTGTVTGQPDSSLHSTSLPQFSVWMTGFGSWASSISFLSRNLSNKA